MSTSSGGPGRVVCGGSQATRVIYGVEVDVAGSRPVRFPNEVARWAAVRDGIDGVRKAVGSTEKGLHTTLSECYAYACMKYNTASEAEGGRREQMELFPEGDGKGV